MDSKLENEILETFKSLTLLAEENRKSIESLRLFLLALADNHPNKQELLQSYREMLSDYQKCTGLNVQEISHNLELKH